MIATGLNFPTHLAYGPGGALYVTQLYNPDENASAGQVKLTPEDLKRIDELAPKGVAAGTRYPAAMMGTIAK